MASLKAFVFDVFGTVVDWRTGVAREAADAFARLGKPVDPDEFADVWSGLYQPGMERVRRGERGFVPLDEPHRDNLATATSAFGIDDGPPASRVMPAPKPC